LFVFEECAGVEDVADDAEFVGREEPAGGFAGGGGGEAELLAEVEVGAVPVPEAAVFEGIAERGLAGSGGADDEEGGGDADRLKENGRR
jgi:hypothetical protein